MTIKPLLTIILCNTHVLLLRYHYFPRNVYAFKVSLHSPSRRHEFGNCCEAQFSTKVRPFATTLETCLIGTITVNGRRTGAGNSGYRKRMLRVQLWKWNRFKVPLENESLAERFARIIRLVCKLISNQQSFQELTNSNTVKRNRMYVIDIYSKWTIWRFKKGLFLPQ